MEVSMQVQVPPGIMMAVTPMKESGMQLLIYNKCYKGPLPAPPCPHQ